MTTPHDPWWDAGDGAPSPDPAEPVGDAPSAEGPAAEGEPDTAAVSPADPADADPVAGDPSPSDPALGTSTPADSAPAGPTPADSAPADSPAADPTSEDPNPSGSTPADLTPSSSTPADSAPADSASADPTPSGPTPGDPVPADSDPFSADATLVNPTLVDPTLVDPTPADAASANPDPSDPSPADPVSADRGPAWSDVTAPVPAEQTAADQAAADSTVVAPGVPSSPVDGAQVTAPAEAVTKPARSRRDLVALVAALVVVGLLAAGVALLCLRLRDAQRTETAREQAVAASRDAARLLFSYDHSTLEADFARGLAVTTGEFREEYTKTTRDVVADVAKEYKAVVLADVVESAVVDADPDRVTTIVFLNQATTSTRVEGQQVDASRVLMTLVERDGRWLVSKVEAL